MTSSGPTNYSPDTDAIIANQLTDYQFITAPLQTDLHGVVLRCASGLGPPGTSNNLVLGGWYYGRSKIFSGSSCAGGFSSLFNSVFVVHSSLRRFPGIINLYACGSLTADEEGVYSCVMMNSSMINQTTRVGLYLSGRSESVDMYCMITRSLHNNPNPQSHVQYAYIVMYSIHSCAWIVTT